MPTRTKKTPIVLVYDSTDDGRFAVYDNGFLVFEASDEHANYGDFVRFCDKFNIPYEERDMPEGLGGEEFPLALEDLAQKPTVSVEIDSFDPTAYVSITAGTYDSTGWLTKADAIEIRDRLVEALGKC